MKHLFDPPLERENLLRILLWVREQLDLLVDEKEGYRELAERSRPGPGDWDEDAWRQLQFFRDHDNPNMQPLLDMAGAEGAEILARPLLSGLERFMAAHGLIDDPLGRTGEQRPPAAGADPGKVLEFDADTRPRRLKGDAA